VPCDSFQGIEIDPLNASTALLPNGSYLTRLYTTLSADEMTLDPTFDYNTQMGDQSAERRATLRAACGDNGTEWTLTLGAGTGREGDLVVSAGIWVYFVYCRYDAVGVVYSLGPSPHRQTASVNLFKPESHSQSGGALKH